MSEAIDAAKEVVAEHLDDIKRIFKPGAKIMVLVRFDGFPERDFCMMDDQPKEEILAAIDRSYARGPDKK